MRHSLKDTILDKITIDEFTPKSGVSEEVAVVAFYAVDDQPAQDLNTYIQRGYIDVIDAEVSPNPDEDGHYLIFVEIARDNNFLEVFLRLIKDVENVTGKIDWKVEPYSAEQAFDIDDPALVQHLTFGNVTESISRFLSDSDTAEIVLEKEVLNFGKIKGNLKDFGHVDRILAKHPLAESAFDYESAEANALESMLGAQYQVAKYGNTVYIAHASNDNTIVLTDLVFTHSR